MYAQFLRNQLVYGFQISVTRTKKPPRLLYFKLSVLPHHVFCFLSFIEVSVPRKADIIYMPQHTHEKRFHRCMVLPPQGNNHVFATLFFLSLHVLLPFSFFLTLLNSLEYTSHLFLYLVCLPAILTRQDVFHFHSATLL